MAVPPGALTQAFVRFGDPDTSIPASERGLYSFPAFRSITDATVMLHNVRENPDIAKGADGLDVQGFAYIKHRSAMADGDKWFKGDYLEEIYAPEVCDLLCKITGAKAAKIVNMACRRKLVELQQDPSFVSKKGDAGDLEVSQLPKDRMIVMGKEKSDSIEPARPAHIDYTVEGLRRTIRECRRDISALGKDYLDAEKAGVPTADLPRIAAFSVWRPIKTVKRDPLIFCDYRTVEKAQLIPSEYRHPSEDNEDGEYLMESYAVAVARDISAQRWYWIPEQTQDEVLIIKFADSEAEKDPKIANGIPHCSPMIPGTENEEARVSVEARVIAFW